MAVTALNLIQSAMRLIGALGSGETLESQEATDGLTTLNQMLDGWSADRLGIFTTRSDDFALTIGKQAYTLGANGDFNMTRPARIDAMSSILLSNPSNPIEFPIAMYSVEDWQNKLPVKAVNSSFPLLCYDDGGFPYRTLNFWPIPQDLNKVRIYSWQALSTLTLQSPIAFPAGYAEALRYNLAVRIGSEFGFQPNPVVLQIANESLARLKTMNAPELTLDSDLRMGPGYDYKADLFGIAF